MERRTILVRGETWVTVEVVAECYGVELSWVHEVHALGLVGTLERHDDTRLVRAAMLDRFAQILRLQRQLGLNLEGVATVLGEPDPESPR